MNGEQMQMSPDAADLLIVEAAKSAAGRYGVVLTQPASDLLLVKARPALHELNERGKLAARQEQVQQNTARLLHFIVTEIMRHSGEITEEQMRLGLAGICKFFPDLFPFCP